MSKKLNNLVITKAEEIQALTLQIIALSFQIGREDVADGYLEALHNLYTPAGPALGDVGNDMTFQNETAFVSGSMKAN
jgi:hypothetical protein